MNEDGVNERFVDDWLAKRAPPMTAAHLADLLVNAVDAICTHSRTVLGDVTLEAICSRTLAQARLKHPFLAVLGPRITSSRPGPEDPRAALAAASIDELHAATRLIIVELLGVLARLTGGVLTPRLYADLEAVPLGEEMVESRRTRQKKGG